MSNLQMVLDRFDNIIARLDKVEKNVDILMQDSSKKYDMTSVLDGIKLVMKNMIVLNNKMDGLKNTNILSKNDIIVEIDKINTRLNEINDCLYEMTREKEDDNKAVYTDQEIYELKQSLSWNKLCKRTGWKKSTLQWHYYKYKRDNGIV